jgi:hypothetical protein
MLLHLFTEHTRHFILLVESQGNPHQWNFVEKKKKQTATTTKA